MLVALSAAGALVVFFTLGAIAGFIHETVKAVNYQGGNHEGRLENN